MGTYGTSESPFYNLPEGCFYVEIMLKCIVIGWWF